MFLTVRTHSGTPPVASVRPCFLDNNLAPLFKIPFPAGIVPAIVPHPSIFELLTVSSWYLRILGVLILNL